MLLFPQALTFSLLLTGSLPLTGQLLGVEVSKQRSHMLY